MKKILSFLSIYCLITAVFANESDVFEQYKGIRFKILPLQKDEFSLKVKLLDENTQDSVILNQISLLGDYTIFITIKTENEAYFTDINTWTSDRTFKAVSYKNDDNISISKDILKSICHAVASTLSEKKLDWDKIKSISVVVKFFNIFPSVGTKTFNAFTSRCDLDIAVLRALLMNNSAEIDFSPLMDDPFKSK